MRRPPSAVAAAASAFATSWGSARGSSSTGTSSSPVGRHEPDPRHAVVARAVAERDVTRGRVGEGGHHDRVVGVADRDRVGRLVLEDARLGGRVGVDGAVPVEVVGGEVQPGGHLRGEALGEPKPERRRLDDEHVDGVVEGGDEAARRCCRPRAPCRPDASSMSVTIVVTVVLPSVPVMATTGR